MDPIFNLDDFQSVILEVSILNETTSMMIQDGQQIFKSKAKTFKLEKRTQTVLKKRKDSKFELKFCEFLDDGIVLDLPKKSCSKGDEVVVRIETYRAKKNVCFLARTEVTKVREVAGERLSADMKLLDYDEDDWSTLQATFSDRQNQITEFFESVKD